MRHSLFSFLLLVVSSVSLSLLMSNDRVIAATLQLSWADNSSNEDGFHIERKLGNTGTYSIVATTAANITSYTDSGLAESSTYCYRVNAFNTAGASPYAPEICGTTAAAPIITFNLTVSLQGSGVVTSLPAAINCGATCSASFNSGTALILKAVAATGYTFSGWSGDADCLDGSVTVNANRSCTAIFTANPVISTGHTLTVSAVGTITTAGSGSGKIVSSPTGIDCGSKCSATFQAGAIVTLQAIPAAGSTFAGWSGDADCMDGSVTMNGNKSCSASFKLISYGLTILRSGTGSGTVTSSLGGINCGTSCGAEFAQRTVVKLIPAPAVDSVFSGWNGDADCLDGSVTMNVSKTCSAVFTHRIVSNIGLYRPSTGAWYLVANNTGLWQDCNLDRCIGPFGADTDVPLVGDWNGTGKLKLGVYDPKHKKWELDANNSSGWQGCKQDTCFNFSLNPPSGEREIPLVGSWDGESKSSVGLYKLVTNPTTTKDKKSGKNSKTTNTLAGYWYFDRNGDGKWDGCSVDLCYGPFGQSGDVPLVGDWNGNGVAKIGVFTPQTGMWTLDYNGNGKVDDCATDKCFGPFGSNGDIPVVGDWSGTGTAKIGVFRAATGEWFLDMNGNGKFDGCAVDACPGPFGQPGDLPVVGKW